MDTIDKVMEASEEGTDLDAAFQQYQRLTSTTADCSGVATAAGPLAKKPKKGNGEGGRGRKRGRRQREGSSDSSTHGPNRASRGGDRAPVGRGSRRVPLALHIVTHGDIAAQINEFMTTKLKEIISGMERAEVEALLLREVDRDPDMMFDLINNL
ncbi:uncharacterized protein LOC578409 [Strongylocentrotus purpuratus]|uniref:Uncharacterized protein n=1 Tax=Strongylocentrotus purpuratus TaxID=7668 RepID=A0A7M7SVV9_STRPU|nr:uncharacterized protein LOC578409 [Strongylocentrotus purpuratus]